MSAVRELQGGPSDAQRRHANAVRVRLLADLEEQVPTVSKRPSSSSFLHDSRESSMLLCCHCLQTAKDKANAHLIKYNS